MNCHKNTYNLTNSCHVLTGVEVFIVEWCDMILLNSSASFQLHIYSNGTLVLAYEKVAEMIRNTGITSVTSSFPWITADTKGNYHYHREWIFEVRDYKIKYNRNSKGIFRFFSPTIYLNLHSYTASGDIVYFQYEQIKIASEDIGNDTSIILNLRTNCQVIRSYEGPRTLINWVESWLLVMII